MTEEKLKKLVEMEAAKETELMQLSQAGALIIIGFYAEYGISIEEIFENIKKWTYKLKNKIESEDK